VVTGLGAVTPLGVGARRDFVVREIVCEMLRAQGGRSRV
jgi:hypothetical protein